MAPRKSRRTARPGRALGWILGGAFGFLLFAALVAYFSINAFLRSPGFRQLAEKETGKLLQTEGTFAPLDWSGDGVYSASYNATGAGGSLQSIGVDQLRAGFDFSKLLDRTIRIRTIHALSAEVEFGKSSGAPAAANVPDSAPFPGGGGSWWKPEKFELEEAVVDSATLRWPGGGSFEGLSAKIKPSDAGGWNAATTGGKLRLPSLPELGADHIRARIQSGVVHVLESHLRLGDGGEIDASGKLDFTPNGALAMDLEFRRIPLEPLLPARWKKVLGGEFAGASHLERRPGSVVARGDLNLDGATLSALPVLDHIATFTRTDRFRNMTLQHVRGSYTYDGLVLNVSKFEAESQGLLRVEGSFTVANGEIDGGFDVGVAPATLRWLPGAQARVFTVDRGGYMWTKVKISGPIDSPAEDLSARLVAAMSGTVIDTAIQGVGGMEETVKEGAKGVIDLLLPGF